MKLKFNQKSNMLHLVRLASFSAFALCSTFTLFQPEAVNSQQPSSTSPTKSDVNQQNGINSIDTENPSTPRQNPATTRQDSIRNDSLTAPNSNLPGRGTYTEPRSSSSPSGTQGSMNQFPSTGTDGNTDQNVGGSRRTNPSAGSSDSSQNMRTDGSSTQDSTNPSMGVGGSSDSNVGGSRRTSPNTSGNQNTGTDGNTNSNTDGRVNSTTEMNGTTNNSGDSSGNTSGAVPGLW